MKRRVLMGTIICSMLVFVSCAKIKDSEIKTVDSNETVNSKETVNSNETVNSKETDSIQISEDIKLMPETEIEYTFKDVSVHDPSVIEVDGTYYIFGSHLAGAKSEDLMNWTLIGSGVNKSNPIIPDAKAEMPEAFEWAKTNTFWAPDVIQLEDKKFYMYYCTCEGSSPLSTLGVAVSDKVEGPYKDLGIFLKSGMGVGTPSEDGDTYDATKQPNVVDPCLYYDADGKLWMMYGSYSGGIFVLEMNPKTGFPLESGYGTKVLGANHVRVEGSYVMYSPETKYYYMFLSFGGLTADGGYNIRVARSKTPNGPFYDPKGNDMINCKGAPGTFFDDNAIYEYGAKLMGNFRFELVEGEEAGKRRGYVSPGHNSAYFNEEEGKYYLIFHTRFEQKGESHEVRVHQMYMNEDGWPVVSPYRYTGETIGSYTEEQVTGIYKYINHGNTVSKEVVVSELIEYHEDHTISGAVNGTWTLKSDGVNVDIAIGEDTYKGVFNIQWDEFGKKNVMTFTALSDKGIAIWGSGIAALE
jgi:arabinan endo-1,5-alpha-L-arabinosidase